MHFCLLTSLLLTACQPIRPVDVDPVAAPAASIVTSSTTTTGAVDCPIVTDQPVDLIIQPQWKAGDARLYRASHKLTRIDHDREKPTITTSYSMSVTVLEASDDGFVMEWPLLAFSPSPRKVRLEYAVSPYGEFMELNNAGQLQEVINYFVQQLLIIPGQPLPSTYLDEIPAEVIEQATTMTTDTVRTFHAIYGLYFTNADPYQWEQPVTMPFGNTGTLHTQATVMRYGAQEGCLHLHWESVWEADPVETGASGDGNAPGMELTIVLERRANYMFDLNTGWLQSVTMEVTGIVNGVGQTEQLTLMQVPLE
jgi:hypothetical protein